MWYEWFFQGIGTEIVMLIVGIIFGGFVGYKIGIKKNGLQKQIAKDKAKQEQELEIDNNIEGDGINGNLRQVQKAGSKAEQSQVGKIRR
ncbi:hypothetical protein [Oribacterium sp. WCC10]|uniref:hypothetical protein n=1 Tax=Oribacterium sp. WCC10 TaxID=1855343 RepID=UPI0008E05CD7|nr:hypothetical protein [Oribacterium sp. WCC10]SFG73051.1 hypothetical protein SAMN05216356_1228 [Oribacterium sp. WCC10]